MDASTPLTPAKPSHFITQTGCLSDSARAIYDRIREDREREDEEEYGDEDEGDVQDGFVDDGSYVDDDACD